MNEYTLIAGMAIATFLTRYPIMVLVSRIELSANLKSALKYVPTAVLSAIIFPLIFLENGELSFGMNNAFLMAAIISAIISWRTRNLLLTILIGMLSFWVFRFLT